MAEEVKVSKVEKRRRFLKRAAGKFSKYFKDVKTSLKGLFGLQGHSL